MGVNPGGDGGLYPPPGFGKGGMVNAIIPLEMSEALAHLICMEKFDYNFVRWIFINFHHSTR